MLTPYPTSFTGAAAILLRKYRGEEVSGPELAHACYEMVGYGLGQLYPDGSDTMVGSRAAAMGAIAAAPTLADEQMCAQLETMAHCHAGGPLVGFVIPWAAILKKLLPLILDLL